MVCEKQLTIMQFAGHGGTGGSGHENGCEVDGLTEKDWTLDFARETHGFLINCRGLNSSHSKPVLPIKMLLGRDEDKHVSLHERGMMSRDERADLVICHHLNAYETPALDGITVFCLPEDETAREVGATIIRCAPRGLLPRKFRTTPAMPYGWTNRANNVLMPHRHTCAILIEWGFATSPVDFEILTSRQARPTLYAALLAGVTRFLELRRGI